MHDGGTDWYFNSGAKAKMQQSASSYFSIADKNWPALRNQSSGKSWAPYCFNTNLVVTNSTADDDEHT